MDIVCVGGGPGGLLLAILTKLASPANRLTVLERNGPDDTFGFGVVFSDETLANLRGADPVTFDRIEAEMRYWPDIEVQYRGHTLVSGGHGFAALEPASDCWPSWPSGPPPLDVEVRFHGPVSDPRSVTPRATTWWWAATASTAWSGARGATTSSRRSRWAGPSTSGSGPTGPSTASPSSSPRLPAGSSRPTPTRSPTR